MTNILRLTSVDVSESYAKRVERVREAITWPKGSGKQEATELWSDGDSYVGVLKPGKEASEEWVRGSSRRQLNENDMLPVLTHRGVPSRNASFTDIFGELIDNHLTIESARLLGALIVRSAFMADHSRDTHGHWHYSPASSVIDKLSSDVPMLYGVPLLAFLHYLDVLALQEDVKYSTIYVFSSLGKGAPKKHDLKKGIGRVNNLLTCANVLAADIRAISYARVLGGLILGRGVAALSLADCYRAFPELS